jgi:hypothetical protein
MDGTRIDPIYAELRERTLELVSYITHDSDTALQARDTLLDIFDLILDIHRKHAHTPESKGGA